MSLSNTEKHVKDIRRKTRRKFSSEEKIRIVLDGWAVSIQSLNYAAGKALTIISTIAGAKTSWKLARDDCLAIRFAKPVLMK